MWIIFASAGYKLYAPSDVNPMILCVSPTPVLQRAALVDSPVAIGEINSFNTVSITAGGMGTNVAYSLFLAGASAQAVFPAPEISHYMRLINESGLPHDRIDVPGPIPMHSAVIESSLRTTEFRDPPMPLDSHQLAMLRDKTIAMAEHCSEVLLTGPLPLVATHGWYGDVLRSLALYHPHKRVSIASSGPALQAVLRQVGAHAPYRVICPAADIEAWAGLCPDETASAWEHAPEETAADLVRRVEPLLNAGISSLLIGVHRKMALSVTSEEASLGIYQDSPGYLAIPWRDSLVAGYFLALARHDEHHVPTADSSGAEPVSGKQSAGAAALRGALAYANARGNETCAFLPTPDCVSTEAVRTITL